MTPRQNPAPPKIQDAVATRRSSWNLGSLKTRLVLGCSSTHTRPRLMMRYIAKSVLRGKGPYCPEPVNSISRSKDYIEI